MAEHRRPVLHDFIVLGVSAHVGEEIRRKLDLARVQRSPDRVEIIQDHVAVDIDLDVTAACHPREHQVGRSFFQQHDFLVENAGLQQFAERIHGFSGTRLAETARVLGRSAVEAV